MPGMPASIIYEPSHSINQSKTWWLAAKKALHRKGLGQPKYIVRSDQICQYVSCCIYITVINLAEKKPAHNYFSCDKVQGTTT